MNMRFNILVFVALFSIHNLFAQEIKPVLEKTDDIPIEVYHDSLKIYNDLLVNGATEDIRARASYEIIKSFSRALRKKNAFSYHFDSLTSVAILTPEDQKFKIFTWQLELDNGTYRYFGVIQSNDMLPKLQPLVDYGDFYEDPSTVIVDGDRWIGALYYNIIPYTYKKQTYYALLGWDGNNAITNKKYIEILWFDESGKAKFGYPAFETHQKNNLCRYILEYRKDATLSLNYYSDEKRIFFDHLVPMSGNEEAGAFEMVPDGTIEAFELKKGKWRHINMVDYDRLEDGEAPNVSEKQKRPLYQPQQKR
ncbi:MAG TPA: hypothetical protein VFD65_03825 [Chitinophagales bacterium]|nr:hypothetical protein [Chitinophagales bacterium]